jgi:hypothetical protein
MIASLSSFCQPSSSQRLEPTIDIPDSVAFFQLDSILYSASRALDFNISQAIYHYQGLKNVANITTKKCNGNQIIYNITKKEINMDYAGLCSVIVFAKCHTIKNISLKAVPYNGNTVELVVQYFSVPNVFLTNHGKRKFNEPPSLLNKKSKYPPVKYGTYY